MSAPSPLTVAAAIVFASGSAYGEDPALILELADEHGVSPMLLIGAERDIAYDSLDSGSGGDKDADDLSALEGCYFDGQQGPDYVEAAERSAEATAAEFMSMELTA